MTLRSTSQQKRSIKKPSLAELALESRVLALTLRDAAIVEVAISFHRYGCTYISQARLATIAGVGGTKSPETAACKITTKLDLLDIVKKTNRGAFKTCLLKINPLFLSPYIIAVLARYLPSLNRLITIWQQIIQFLEKKEERESRYRKVTNFYDEVDDDVGFRYETSPFV
jgi:hypothetical protein